MEKRINSRAIIIEDDSIITLFRRKIKDDGSIKEYYAIPGGGLEANETLEENVVREIKEEIGVNVNILGYLGKVEDETSITHFFHCQKISGIERLGGPEKDRNSADNYYELKHLKLDQLNRVNILYVDIIEKAINRNYLK